MWDRRVSFLRGFAQRGSDQGHDIGDAVGLQNVLPRGKGIVLRESTRRHEQFQVRAPRVQSPYKFKTAHRAGQPDVGEDKIYWRSGFDMLHGLVRISHLDYAHARLAQRFGDDDSDQDLVLDDENLANFLGPRTWVRDHSQRPANTANTLELPNERHVPRSTGILGAARVQPATAAMSFAPSPLASARA